jgi:hypothetical protein
VLLLDNDVPAMILDIAAFKLILMLSNLAWFLTCQMVLMRFIIAAVMVTLHWGDQFNSVIFHMSSTEVKWRVKSKHFANQDQRWIAKSHSKKIWKDDSICLQQKLHMEGRKQPLFNKCSSIGTLSCINLQTRRDFEGG